MQFILKKYNLHYYIVLGPYHRLTEDHSVTGPGQFQSREALKLLKAVML